MPSTYSVNLRLELQATGENRTTWGSKANNDFNLIEDAIAGCVDVPMGNANTVLTSSNGVVDQARNQMLMLSGTHTAIRTLTIPAVSKTYIIYNGTSGGFAVSVSNGTNSVSIANGKWYWVWTDGALMFSSPALGETYALLSQLVDLSGVTNATTARTNLGLGDMAVQNSASVNITGGSVSGITDLAIADGGTGASTAANARTNLGLGTMAVQNSGTVAITGGTITGITDLAVADGGTGASDAAGARTNFGLGTMAVQNAGTVAITGGTVTGITDITVADGGTGASTAAGARTNLGVAIGTDVQAADATLTSLAAISGVAGDVIYANGNDSWTNLAKGTSLQFLTMNAGATAPQWYTPPFTKSFESSQQAYTLGGLLQLPHGLGAQPKLYMIAIICVTTEGGWAVNDEYLVNPNTNQTGTGDHGFGVYPDATNINVRIGAESVAMFGKTSGFLFTLTPARWKIVVRAWA